MVYRIIAFISIRFLAYLREWLIIEMAFKLDVSGAVKCIKTSQ